MPAYDRALWVLRTWLDWWSGIGRVAPGMHRQGYDLQLTQYDEKDWRETFYTRGMEHSPTSATGTAWERTPWHTTRAGLGTTRSGRVEVGASREIVVPSVASSFCKLLLWTNCLS